MDATEALRSVGLRVTPGRVAVYDVLRDEHRPLSHGQVLDRVGPGRHDQATVYRSLVAMAEAGLVNRMDLGDHIWRFELRGPPNPAGTHVSHPHFVCTECGVVECLDEVDVEVRGPERVAQSVRKRAVEVQLRGRCDDCDASSAP